jgi:transposase-like protein
MQLFADAEAILPFIFKIQNLFCPVLCFYLLRKLRWPDGIQCVKCKSKCIAKDGHHGTDNNRQRYKCECGCRFDDFTGTLFEGSHHGITVWFAVLYLMGLNRSNLEISIELDLHKDVVYDMVTAVRGKVCENKPAPILKGIVEADEVYIVAGHKGNPEEVAKQGREGRRNRLKGARGRGTLEKEKPPVLGIIERGGEVAICMLPNVQIKTIEPIIRSRVEPGSIFNTDEYCIYDRLTEWGYDHKTVCHAKGEYARDDDGDGFHEVHVNTMEGFWCLLRSWLRPHHGISQEKLPLYLGFFATASFFGWICN